MVENGNKKNWITNDDDHHYHYQCDVFSWLVCVEVLIECKDSIPEFQI